MVLVRFSMGFLPVFLSITDFHNTIDFINELMGCSQLRCHQLTVAHPFLLSSSLVSDIRMLGLSTPKWQTQSSQAFFCHQGYSDVCGPKTEKS